MAKGRQVGDGELPTDSAIGQRVRKLRHEHNVSQEELCRLMGSRWNTGTVSKVELGKEQPTLDWLAQVAYALGIKDLGEFFKGLKPIQVMK